jgi:hypothetical protein
LNCSGSSVFADHFAKIGPADLENALVIDLVGLIAAGRTAIGNTSLRGAQRRSNPVVDTDWIASLRSQ